jgi:hypothetical protein
MTVSVGASFLIALIAIVALALFIGIVIWANRRPYFKHPKPEPGPTGVSGGIHQGDPRSMSPPRDELVEPAETAETAETAEQTESPTRRQAR